MGGIGNELTLRFDRSLKPLKQTGVMYNGPRFEVTTSGGNVFLFNSMQMGGVNMGAPFSGTSATGNRAIPKSAGYPVSIATYISIIAPEATGQASTDYLVVTQTFPHP
jgi:hypothetical protein